MLYHRSRDAQAAGVAWSETDISSIKRLSKIGFKVTVTGGLALDDLPLFQGIPIHVFIAGRSIRDAATAWSMPPVSLNAVLPNCGAKGSKSNMLIKAVPLGIYEKALPPG